MTQDSICEESIYLPRVVLTKSAIAMAPTNEDKRAFSPLWTSASDDKTASADIFPSKCKNWVKGKDWDCVERLSALEGCGRKPNGG